MKRRDLIKISSVVASGAAFAKFINFNNASFTPELSSKTNIPTTLTSNLTPLAPITTPQTVPLLPQKDTIPGKLARAGFLSTQQLSYIWTEYVPNANGIPLAISPPQDLPTIEWLLKFVKILIDVAVNFFGSIPATIAALWQDQLNAIKADLASAETLYAKIQSSPNLLDPVVIAQAASIQASLLNTVKKIGVLFSGVLAQLNTLYANHSIRSEDAYKASFSTFPLPDIANNFQQDEVFANLRVAGINPILIQGVSSLPAKFPLTNTQYQQVMGQGDDLISAGQENRLYILDYVENGLLATSGPVFKLQTGVGYSYAPIALFALPRGGSSLVPVAIQCDQDPVNNPIFLPADQKQESAYWAWQMAKTVVQSADECYHEMFVHLVRTHLVSEAICVATHRNLAETHPLYALLVPHFEGTLFINELATVTLLPPLLFIDDTFAAPIQNVQKAVAKDRLAFDFYEHMLPNDIEKRKVSAANLPNYPYRDDGLLLWNAIADWAKDYINTYYQSDRDVVGDYELIAWTNDIIKNGKIKGFKSITSKSQLIDVITMIIFTASAQHAAVNYSQAEYSLYAPAVSALLSAPAPTSIEGKNKAEWLKMLPPMISAVYRVAQYEILVGFRHTSLGQYRSNIFPFPPLITDPAITQSNGPLSKFQSALKNIETTINTRNRMRKPYEYLLPSRIPASTNT